jgi:4-amino-4-deoxy-L-arabinose transferase-like glycosyltransferase
MAPVTGAAPHPPRSLLLWYGLSAVLAVFTYFYGLDSSHIPKNGDEFPYEHITRMTAASGHWLPLESEVPELRNTKPPLLFWQGIVSTSRAENWTLWHLRWPSVIYTLLTAAMVCLLGWKLSARWHTGLVALLTFLAFFGTYRYGRPFLTDAPSVFWLFVPCFALVFWQPAVSRSRTTAPILLGLATGLGLLYKSFALVVPVGAWVAWSLLRQRRYAVRVFLARDLVKLVILAAVALAVFGLWFVLDPDPRAIVDKFVLQENAGKFNAPGGYLRDFFWGSSSIWRLAVSYPLNAGLLMFPVIALFFLSFARRARLDEGERLLWMWVITLFVVFSLPSQRDERYLLPAMPALAVLCALNWDRIGGRAFTGSLIAAGTTVLLLAYLALRLEQAVPGDALYPMMFWVLVTATLALVLVSLAAPGLSRRCVNVAVLLAMTSFAAFVRPFDGPPGTYGANVQKLTTGRTVWVPANFIAREEGHRFLLPGADVRGYPLDSDLTAADLAARYPLFAIRVPMHAPEITAGKVLGQRLDIGTRHTPGQIVDMLRGNVFDHLFIREVLVEATPIPGHGARSPG